MNRLLERMFENRGYSKDMIISMDEPLGGKLLDIDLFCSVLHQAYLNHDPVVILSDFDMDGIMGGVIGYAGLAELGFSVSLFCPDPSEGYGFSKKTIDRLLSEFSNTKVIVTADTGISELDSISYAKSLGMTVLVTDHHVQKQVSAADVIVDPSRLDEVYPNPGICGACVLYFCLKEYAALYGTLFQQEQIDRLCLFAGIGTVSDMMPLLHGNRQLVRESLSLFRIVANHGNGIPIPGTDVYQRAFYGIRVLYLLFGTHNISCKDESFYGFYLAPMFNSVKRMSGSMEQAFGVFFGQDPYRSAEYLWNLNEERKEALKFYRKDLDQLDQPYKPYVYFSNAPAGVVGLLAGELSRDTGLPCVVLNANTLTGSGRSPSWYPFLDQALSENFHVAGHNQAFGLSLQKEDECARFFDFISKDVDVFLSSTDIQTAVPDFVISYYGDGDVGLEPDVLADYLFELENYRPFGNSFPEPFVQLRFPLFRDSILYMGAQKEHAKIVIPGGIQVVLFHQSELLNTYKDGAKLSVFGHLCWNVFAGIMTLQFMGHIDR